MPATASVFLNVHDFQRSLEFYKKLGFRVDKTYNDDEGNPSWADLSFQGAEIGLGRIGSNDDPEFQKWCSTPLGAGVVVYLSVSNVKPSWAKAQESGATIEQPLTERPYGTMFTVNDPDGYTLSFIQEPRKRAAASGSRKSAKKTTKKAARKTATKGAKTSAKKTSKKSAKKSATKKSAKRTTAKRAGKKSAKRAGKKGARRS